MLLGISGSPGAYLQVPGNPRSIWRSYGVFTTADIARDRGVAAVASKRIPIPMPNLRNRELEVGGLYLSSKGRFVGK